MTVGARVIVFQRASHKHDPKEDTDKPQGIFEGEVVLLVDIGRDIEHAGEDSRVNVHAEAPPTMSEASESRRSRY